MTRSLPPDATISSASLENAPSALTSDPPDAVSETSFGNVTCAAPPLAPIEEARALASNLERAGADFGDDLVDLIVRLNLDAESVRLDGQRDRCRR